MHDSRRTSKTTILILGIVAAVIVSLTVIVSLQVQPSYPSPIPEIRVVYNGHEYTEIRHIYIDISGDVKKPWHYTVYGNKS